MADASFNPSDRGFGFGHGFNGDVFEITLQSDGKVVAIGNFTRYNGALVPGIARLKGNNQGLDSGFVIGTGFGGGQPKKIAVQPDGKILICGSFSSFNGNPANQLVRLLSNGQVDPSFSVGLGPFPSEMGITALALLPDGKILAAGNFTTFNGSSRAMVVRLHENGNLDMNFNAGSAGSVAETTIRDIEVQADGKILLAGIFKSTFNGLPISFNHGAVLLRLLPNGGLDNSFSILENTLPGGNGGHSICLATDGSPVLAGNFGALWKKYSSPSFSTIYHFIKLKSDGTADQYFKSSVLTNPTESIFIILPSGNQFIIGGQFSKIGSPSLIKKGNLAKIIPADIDNAAASNIDIGFAPDSGANGSIFSLALEPSGKVLAGGQFSRMDQKARFSLARLNNQGQVDSPLSLGTGADRAIHSMVVQPDQKLLIGGDFGYYNWNWANGIARILPNGDIDPGFNIGTGFNGVVRIIALQNDGKILVGGHFNAYQGISRNGIVRLLPGGAIDPTFDPGLGTNDTVFSLAFHESGKILLGGSFTSFNGQQAGRIIRLLANGQIDPSFQTGSGVNGTIRKVAVFQDSIIFVAGQFSTINGATRRGIARLQINGGLSFSVNQGPGLNQGSVVYAIAFQPDGKLILGGRFSTFNENSAPNIFRMSPEGILDGSFTPGSDFQGTIKDLFVYPTSLKILAVGHFSGIGPGARNHLIRFKPNGIKDGTAGSGNGPDEEINCIATANSGFIYGGMFTQFDGQPCNSLGRLQDEQVLITTWNGTFWDNGIPEFPLHTKINGHYSGAGFSCKDLMLEQGFNCHSTGDIHIGGNVSSNSNSISGRWVLNGQSQTQLLTGFVHDITIENPMGVLLTGPTFLTGTLKMKEGTLSTQGRLTLTSNSSLTGRIATIEPEAAITGEVNIQRFIPASSQGWYFLAVPCYNQTRAQWSDHFPIPANGIFLHNEGGTLNIGDQINGWEYPSGTALPIGKGYRVYIPNSFFAGNKIIDNKGPIHTGDFPFPVSYTPTGFGGGGWNFIGNPYPCEIDWHALNKQNMGGEYHIWNKNKYGSYSQGMGMGVNGPGRYIPSHQAFFVKASGPSPTLLATEASKPATPQSPVFLRTNTSDPADAVRIKLLDFQDNQDETALRFMEETTHDFDPMFDAHKLQNDGLSLSTLSQDGQKLSLQARPFADGEIIQIGYGVKSEGQYLLRFTFGTELMTNRTWYLRDNDLGSIYTLLTNFTYPFTVSDGVLESNWRFSIVGVNNPVSGEANIQNPEIMAIPNPAQGQLSILNAQSLDEIFLFDYSGKRVGKWSNPERKSRLELNIESISSGVYQLMGWGQTAKISKAIMIKSEK